MASVETTTSVRSPRSLARGHLAPEGRPSFLGRAKEISEVKAAIDAHSLVTLTGPPGIGKTCLALQAAERTPDGSTVADLARVNDPELVPGALASALSLREEPSRSLTDTIVADLCDRRLLVVLDNCEHVMGACAQLVDDLLRRCPSVRVLATSREPLSVAGELVWQVPPLSLPAASESDLAELLKSEAVRLFVERAASVEPEFALNTYVGPALGEICRRLDGIPLAIELAAARVGVLTPPEIARRLDDRLDLLTTGSSSNSPRHRTLEAALAWSYQLLGSSERALLRRLSVFAGPFDASAAEAVCSDNELGAAVIADLLGQLVAKSLAVADTTIGRYRLLETVRAYAGERLEEAHEAALVREAHARFYLALAEEAESKLTGPHQQRWFDRLERERCDFCAAVEWSAGHGRGEWALRLAGALVIFWRVRCHFSEGRHLLEAALAAGDAASPALQTKGLWGAGLMALMAGDLEVATPMLEKSLAECRDLGDLQGCARALLVLGSCRQQSEHPGVLSLFEESAALARKAGDPWCLALALAFGGLEHVNRLALSSARPLFEECLEISRQAGDKQSLRLGLLGLGQVAYYEGDFRSAEPLLEEVVAVAEELGDDYTKGFALQFLAGVALRTGDYARANQTLALALCLLRGSQQRDTEFSLVTRAWLARAEGDHALARRLLEEALTLVRSNPRALIPVLIAMGELAAEEDDGRLARRLFDESLDMARSLGIDHHAARALHGLGELERGEADAKRAAVLHKEALELWHRIGSALGIAASLEAVAGLSAANGSAEHAARIFGAADALREAKGSFRAPWEAARYEADFALVCQALPRNELGRAVAKGRDLAIDEAVRLASKAPHRRQDRTSSGWSSLTPSERQVASLAADGLTNREIGELLFISTGSVKDHLSKVFQKLGFTRRTELARELGRPRLDRDT